MAPNRNLKLAAFRLDEDLIAGLQAVWERDGIQASEQVRRAVRAWLEAKGVLAKRSAHAIASRKRS